MRDAIIKADPRSSHQERFFVLTRVYLIWFKRQDDGSSLLGAESGRVCLKDLLPINPKEDISQTPKGTAIKLSTRSKVYQLRSFKKANEMDDLRNWVEAIRLAKELPADSPAQSLQMPAMKSSVEDATGILAIGYLEKARDGVVRAGWTRRLFVLTNRLIFYYKCADPNMEIFGEERGRFNLQDVRSVECNHESDPQLIQINIDRPVITDRVVLIRAASARDAEEWTSAIKQCIEKLVAEDGLNVKLRSEDGTETSPRRLFRNGKPSSASSADDDSGSLAGDNEGEEPLPETKFDMNIPQLVVLGIGAVLCVFQLLNTSFSPLWPIILVVDGVGIWWVVTNPARREAAQQRKIEEARGKVALEKQAALRDNAGPKPTCGKTVPFDPEKSGKQTCSKGDATIFDVRKGPNYKKNKLKEASIEAMYDLVATDCISSEGRIEHVAQLMNLPIAEDDPPGCADGPLPRLFIVNTTLPFIKPDLSAASNGPGCSVVMVFRVKPETQKEASDASTASPAVRLFMK
jgi:hypothetical protein